MLVLTGGRVIDPASGFDAVADVVVENGSIIRMGPGAAEGCIGEDVDIIDMSGLWVCPGFIDVHVHFREPGHEYKEDIASGLRAAAAGGYTTVCAMPNTKPVNDCRAITEMMIERGREAGLGRLYPVGAITKGLKGVELAEMADSMDAGSIGATDDGYCVTNSAVMRRALQYAKSFDIPIIQHCEDHDLTEGAQMNEGAVSTKLGLRGWPRVAEDLIVARDILLAADTGARYHVAHMSSGASAAMVREAKQRGLRVSAEVTPHHLLMTDSALLGYDTHCKVNPPLRTEEDRELMIAALADGTVDCIATDHAPHGVVDKDCEFAQASVGINGLETAVASLLALVREGKLSANRLIEAMTISAVRLFPQLDGGRLAVGERADIAVINPTTQWRVEASTLASKSHNTPLLGTDLQGSIVLTIAGGKIIHRRGI